MYTTKHNTSFFHKFKRHFSKLKDGWICETDPGYLDFGEICTATFAAL